MTMRKIVLVFLIVVLGVGVSPPVWAQKVALLKVPLPDDIRIIAPDPALPEDLKTLLGEREGELLPLGLPCKLVVEEIIDSKTIKFVWAQGNLVTPRANFKAGSVRITTKIFTNDDGMLQFSFTYGIGKLSFFKKNGADVLEGVRVNYMGMNAITMKRVQ